MQVVHPGSSSPVTTATPSAMNPAGMVDEVTARLYPQNATETLDAGLFRNPTAEYRGTPFWSWNTRLDVPQLLRQIEQFKQMGFGGFHIHSRTGLETEYLGEEFMSAVRACADKAAAENMLTWLYDEDRWPSGFAGGLVTKDVKHRCKHLLWTPTPYSGNVAEACQDERAAGVRSENGTLLARFDVVIKNGKLASYRRLRESEDVGSARGAVWYAYLETVTPSSWFNHQTYVDTFSVPAIKRFIETTHERYAATLKDYFGTVVPAIFTDEPQFPKKTTLAHATDLRDVILPFTTDFLETFEQTYGQDLLAHLPELYWDLPDGKASTIRYHWHDHTAERFASAFGDTLGQWCEDNGIALTGHMLGEPTLFSQTRGIGEAMRALRGFQIPGIDMLCDRIEFTTAKQAQSVARQYNRAGVVSELYGVTNWDFDFAGHKRQGDWQAAMGVTVRVPHLAWVSMAGESKRDYPAAIGYQSPWYKEYRQVEDHFSRLNTVLTRGKSLVRVGVIHPVESYWLCFGPVDQNQPEMQEREEAFKNVAEWLAYGPLDFDYIAESLLPAQTPAGQDGSRKFHVGSMAYDVVVVPGMRTIRSTTLAHLTDFVDAGGRVIFAGEVPTLVDAVPSQAPAELASRCTQVGLARLPLLAALTPFRDVEVRRADGTPSDNVLYQIRIDGDARHLFLSNIDKEKSFANATVRVRGVWDVRLLDTMNGDDHEVASRVLDGHTEFRWDIAAHGHMLVTLTPRSSSIDVAFEQPRTWVETGRLNDMVPVTLSEPNVLMLDQAEWRIDGGEWNAPEEILRLENKAREAFKLPFRGGRNAQPWTDTSPSPVVGTLELLFTINSEIAVEKPSLAIEDPASLQIQLDGVAVSNSATGWWVDESIKTVALPSFAAGSHELRIKIPFTRKTDVEWCYLLGDFGVAVQGRYTRITAPVRKLAFGDWTHQGLPFYAGNVTYHCKVKGDGRQTHIEAARFKNPLLSVELDGKTLGKIAFAPFQCELGQLKGDHRLDITAFGNRVNAFGPIHNSHERLSWVGPLAWRSSGHQWAYEYQLKRMGVLVAPTIRVSE